MMRNFSMRASLGPLCTIAVLLPTTMMIQACKAKAKAKAVAEQANPNEVSVTPALANNLKFGSPEMRDVVGKLQVAAHVDTDARLIAHVGSPVSGRIMRLLVFEGQNVKAGAVLALLHSTDLSDTQFALIKATSQQNLAATSVKRAEQLLEADVIGQAELERRRAELLQASTEAASYRTQLLGLGMTEEQIPSAIGPIVEASPANNPTPVTRENVEALLRAAWAGKEPR